MGDQLEKGLEILMNQKPESMVDVRDLPNEEELVERLAKAGCVAVNKGDEKFWRSYVRDAKMFLAMMKALQDG